MSKNIVKIYHNPRCSKSRETLSLLENRSITPEIIFYLETSPTIIELIDIIQKLGFTSARQLMRVKEDIYKTLSLDNLELTEKELLVAMVENPILIERPIVIANNQARIGRPVESVLEIL